MKYALLQPAWSFGGSTYFGCRDTHVPLELMYAGQQLEAAGHRAVVLDAHLEQLDPDSAAGRLRTFAPDFVVITTAPTYLFWRCPQPELRVPALWFRRLRETLPLRTRFVAIGPHGSATPGTTLAKLGCDIVVQGEAEQVLQDLDREASGFILPGMVSADLNRLGALDWSAYPLHLRMHRHHVFNGSGRGAEVEASRGCPWACTFCNKTLFRNRFRERPLAAVLSDAEAIRRAGLDYVYFIDEIFGCGRQTPALLAELAPLGIQFGMQTRVDLWNEDSLEALGRAGCISMECGIESISPAGRARFRKGCRLDTDRIGALLRVARRHIPWVQANLIAAEGDDREAIARWRQDLIDAGIWASAPVPVFAFPGTPLYQSLYGTPDDTAWERAHRHYLDANRGAGRYSDIQDPEPQPLPMLESLN